MNNSIPLTEARKNLSELVNQVYYERKLISISKGKKPMVMLVGTSLWKEIIATIEKHDQPLADSLALIADKKNQKIISQGEEEIKKGQTILLDKV